MAVARVDKQPGAVSPLNLAVCALLFQPGEPPCSDELLPKTPSATVIFSAPILAAGQHRCVHSDEQARYAERKQFLHVRFLAPKITDSAAHEFLEFLRVSGALHRDL